MVPRNHTQTHLALYRDLATRYLIAFPSFSQILFFSRNFLYLVIISNKGVSLELSQMISCVTNLIELNYIYRKIIFLLFVETIWNKRVIRLIGCRAVVHRLIRRLTVYRYFVNYGCLHPLLVSF